MIYSCFNERAGHYEYFEDDRGHAINGDLPVPQLAGKQAGRIGVPARDAGRSLPPNVRPAGTGWEARGIIVQCKSRPMRGLRGLGQDADSTVGIKDLLYVIGSAGLGYAISARRGKDPVLGAISFGAVSLIVVSVL